MYFPSSGCRVVVVSNPEHEQELVKAIEDGAPQCCVHFVSDQSEAFKLIAGFQQSGKLPDFVLVDAVSVSAEPEKTVDVLRRLTEHASPIILIWNGKPTKPCKTYGANSCIDRSPASVSAAARYWSHVNLAKPFARFSKKGSPDSDG